MAPSASTSLVLTLPKISINSLRTLYTIIIVFIVVCVLLFNSLAQNNGLDLATRPHLIHAESIAHFALNTTLSELQHCWADLFLFLFVPKYVNYQFNVTRYPQRCKQSMSMDTSSIAPLLHNTHFLLSSFSISDFDGNFSFHQLIALRRYVMIIAKSIPYSPKYQSMPELLSVFRRIETEYNTQHRLDLPLFNIHLSRSGGTSICRLIRIQQAQQSNRSLENSKPIRLNPRPRANCNVGDGFPFFWMRGYENNETYIAPKTCTQQNDMMRPFNFVARESPLYNNKHDGLLHPELCNQFIYILSFRSPIERIISFLRAKAMDIYVNGSQTHNVTYLRDIFHTLYSVQREHFDGQSGWIDNIKDPNIRYYFKYYTTFTYYYGNNAMTRWIGYEHRKRIQRGMDIFDSMIDEIVYINQPNDIHFYNAIENLLQIDFVLNFASYKNDFSSRLAHIHGENAMLNSLVRNFTVMTDASNKRSMWNVLTSFLNKYYRTNGFSWQKSRRVRAVASLYWNQPEEMARALSARDWATLYRQNYWDFKLYSIAKWIQIVDAHFYTKIPVKYGMKFFGNDLF